MKASARHRIEINRPLEEVFDYIADAHHERVWNPVCLSMEQTSPGPIGNGTRFYGRFKRVGAMDFEILEYDRPHYLVHRAHPRMAEGGHVWTLSATEDGTQLDQLGEMRPKGWGWLMAPLMPRIVKQNLSETAVALKKALERPTEP